MKDTIRILYEELRGTRTVNGELKIAGFGFDDYEELYQVLLENLSPIFDGNYYGWYERTCRSYIRFRKANARTYDFYLPQTKNVYEHSTREQLAVLKYFLYRRATGKFTK